MRGSHGLNPILLTSRYLTAIWVQTTQFNSFNAFHKNKTQEKEMDKDFYTMVTRD